MARFHGSADSIFMADKNYPRTNVYLFLGALLILFSKPLKIEGKGRLIIMIFSVVGFVYLSARGLYYSFTDPSGRLRIDSAATASAYLFVLHSFLTLYLVRETRCRWWAFVSLLVVVITGLVVLLTETRSVLIIYPCLLVLYLLLNNVFPVRTVIKTSLLTIGVVLAIVFMFFHGVQDRMIQAWYEVSDYQQNNDTSIGARVSMWGRGYMLWKNTL
ncbi:O-antigen ligase family protein [Mangrovibacter sp. SLW1]